MKLIHAPSGTVLATAIVRPRSFFGRGLGLMFRRRLELDGGMWIEPCNGIHMFFMRFAIDAVFVDRKMRVVRVYPQLRPWRVVPLVWGARSVFELAGGRLDLVRVGLSRGDQLRLENG